jgi:uncharacterized membrane protein
MNDMYEILSMLYLYSVAFIYLHSRWNTYLLEHLEAKVTGNVL